MVSPGDGWLPTWLALLAGLAAGGRREGVAIAVTPRIRGTGARGSKEREGALGVYGKTEKSDGRSSQVGVSG
jgi:hypothetical protein